MKNHSHTCIKNLLKETADKKVILVDFFDTLVFRRIHSYQVYIPWAKALLNRIRLEDVTAEQLVGLRYQAISSLRKEYVEPPYSLVMGKVYSKLDCDVSEQEFISYSLEADMVVELGCQYGNTHLIQFLRAAKKCGQKVYVVSDFYLPKAAYKEFLINAGCDDVIDGVFVSEGCNKTKSGGSIYPYVLENIGVKASDCVMFGDSRQADVMQAEKNGIQGMWYFPLKHKIWTNISRRLKLDYSKRMLPSLARHLYKHTLYDEYALVLFAFAQRLVAEAQKDGVRKLAFVSRGGYLLRLVVNEYLRSQGIKGIDAAYCYASRKVCLTNNADEVMTLKEYLGSFVDNGNLVTVDEGWYCHSQQAISKKYGLPTIGYYLGVRGKDVGYANCERKGILFDLYGNNGKPSKYYGIFCTNCSMYEQMLTSREGSVKGYTRANEGLQPVLKENDVEVKLYDEVIAQWKRRMLLIVRGLCAWKGKEQVSVGLLARIVLRTVLFANRRRCEMMNRLDKDMIDNCHSTKQVAKGVKDVKIDWKNLFVHPEMYLGMACKVQRKVYDRPLLNGVYKVVASGYYLYVRMMNRL